MRTFCNTLKPTLHYRRQIFDAGLQAVGLKPASEQKCDVLLVWNRIGHFHGLAKTVEARGGTVLVAENAAWGNGFLGGQWYSIARGMHNTAGKFPVGGDDRWDMLGVELAPWRAKGGEVVGLPQRGIGPPGTAMPRNWVPPGCTRIRKHPGMNPCVPLEQDLAKASRVVTWGSGAAVCALMWGIRVESHMPNWIARQDNTDEGRLAMFRRLAWAQWRLSEISNGEAFKWLLKP